MALVWSDAAFDRELDYYLRTRRSLTNNTLYHLMARGAPVYSTVNVNDLDAVDRPLLVVNPQLYPEAELTRILDYGKAPVVLIGAQSVLGPEPDLEFADPCSPENMVCRLYGATGDAFNVELHGEAGEAPPADLNAIKEPPTFFDEQYYRKVSDGFWDACANLLGAVSGNAVKLSSGSNVDAPWASVQTLEKADGGLRLLIGNDSFQYVECVFEACGDMTRIEAVSRVQDRPIVPFRRAGEGGKPVSGAGNEFYVRIPPKGMGVIDIELAAERARAYLTATPRFPRFTSPMTEAFCPWRLRKRWMALAW